MKLIYEVSEAETFQELNESTGEKKYKIKGIFSSIGVKNRNGRIYPKPLWETQVSKYQENFSNGSLNTLMEWQHPPRSEVDPMEAIAKIEKLYIKDNYVMGEAVLLNNPKANQIKSLIDNGIKIAVSSRGLGKVSNGIVEDFKLITYDIVTNQSDAAAEMMGITEGILTEKEFEITEDGKITEVQMCTENSCHLFEAEDIKKATMQRFDEILKSFKPKLTESINIDDELDKLESQLLTAFNTWKKINKDIVDEKLSEKIRDGITKALSSVKMA